MDAPAADRASRDASIALGLTLPTDTVLYLLLPLHAATFGVTFAEAGLLLAANRLVRILGYGWIARFYEQHGPRAACSLAVLGAAASSLGYALLPGLWWLLAARLVWGLSFAALNIATQALATAEAGGAARRSGRSRAIIATGPMIGLVAGALIAEARGPHFVFLLLGGIALLALPFALRLPGGHGERVRGAPRFGLPARIDVWSFVQGMALDGVFVLGLSVLAASALGGQGQGAALAAGLALALRYASEIALGPAGGALAHRFGAMRMLVLLSTTSALALAAIGLGGPGLWIGALSVVLLRGLLQPLPAPAVAALNPGADRVPALARLATWRDLGAGAGPLAAGLLLPVLPPTLVYGLTGLALLWAGLALPGPRLRPERPAPRAP
ncbi:MFS transporter [Belnapia rosea]|uniref:Predicted arabinose efflux permease, MFS family n=1 Tax=Belnapia rosea TaxID=938405 RepID=A0A1G6NQJ1_9PROT|nr:MFS transporter [Belnapia rosea]SDC69941.1 Predicted arabinose efflux permease, MFS family [Belnapia rosea]